MTKLGIDIDLADLFQITEDSYYNYSCRVNEVECLVTSLDQYQVVAPRGTEGGELISGLGFIDVIRDLRFYPWYDKRVGWSHAGFLKGAQGLVDKGLFGMLDKDQPILFTGHSLGGVISINMAAMLHAMDFNVSGVYIFGAPRTLMKSAVTRFLKTGIPIIEFSNRGDPIPDFPTRWWGYSHVNEQYTARKGRGYSIANNHLLKHYGENIYV
jgi:hypothetical protein